MGSPDPRAWSAEIQNFLDHWRGLRAVGSVMPTSEQFLDKPKARFMPGCYIIELTQDAAMMRYQGTRLAQDWQRDFTGSDMHDGMREQDKARSLYCIRTALATPCGLYGHYHYVKPNGTAYVSEYLSMPLAVQSGRPPRLVCFALFEGEKTEDSVKAASVWIDIGRGIPAEPPFGGA